MAKSYSRNERHIYVVDPGFQYWFIGKVIVMSLLIVAASLFCLGVVQHIFGDATADLVQPDPFSASNKGLMAPTASVFNLVWPVMVFCLASTLIITFSFALFASHRMAGPVARMRKVMEQMADGDLSIVVRFRKKDALQSLAESLNTLIARWKGSIQELQTLSEDLSVCESSLEREEKLNRIREILGQFKTS